MADNVWDNSEADNDGNVAANWSLNQVPTGTDVAVFDSAETDDNCTFSGAISCAGMRFDNTYAGNVNANGYDITLGTDGLDCSGGSLATLTMGGANDWTCSGDFDIADLGTLIPGSSTLTMDTASTEIIASDANDLYDLVIDADVAIGATTSGYCTVQNHLTVNVGDTLQCDEDIDSDNGVTFTINGTLNVATGKYAMCRNGDATIGASGTASADGTGYFAVLNGSIENSAGGTCSAKLNLWYGPTVKSGTYSGEVEGTNTQDVTFDTGATIVFTEDVQFTATSGARTFTNSSTSLTFQKDFQLVESGGTFAWTTGSGTINLTGGNAQAIDTLGLTLDDIVVNKTAGDVTLSSALATQSLTITSTGTGEFDPNGQTITTTANCSWAAAAVFASGVDGMNGSTWVIGGNFTCDGQDLNATAAWYLQVTGTAVASGTGDVEYCDASGYTQVDATSGPFTDGGTNTNWDFGTPAATMTIRQDGGIRQQSTTTYPVMFFMADSTDLVTGETGLTITGTVSKNGASFVAVLGDINEIGSGYYVLVGNATDRSDLGQSKYRFTAAGAAPTEVTMSIVAHDPFDVAGAVLEELVASHSSVSGSVAERLTRIPDVAPAASGGLPTVDANNRIAGIVGTVVNTFDGMVGAEFVVETHGFDQQATKAELATEIYTDSRGTVYAAHIEGDFSGTTDEYTVSFLENGEAITSGITAPTITVTQRSDDSALISSETLTALSDGFYKYDESTNTVPSGDTALITVSATYDGGTISGRRLIVKYA